MYSRKKSKNHHEHHHGLNPSYLTSEKGIWAIKWSFIGLLATALFQVGIVAISGSVALLADTIHNIGDAATAIPLWIAFTLVKLRPTKRFTYGYGRVEDLAGVVIVVIILFSAVVSGYESLDRLFNPKKVEYIGAVVAASIIGFLGNEVVALFRIRVGKDIGSAALVADGYHARVDGLTSLAVLFGAGGVWLGYPLADPVVGLIITAAIGNVAQANAERFTALADPVVDEGYANCLAGLARCKTQAAATGGIVSSRLCGTVCGTEIYSGGATECATASDKEFGVSGIFVD